MSAAVNLQNSRKNTVREQYLPGRITALYKPPPKHQFLKPEGISRYNKENKSALVVNSTDHSIFVKILEPTKPPSDTLQRSSYKTGILQLSI